MTSRAGFSFLPLLISYSMLTSGEHQQQLLFPPTSGTKQSLLYWSPNSNL